MEREKPKTVQAVPPTLSSFVDALRLDFATIKTILLTALVVLVVVFGPFLWLLRKVVTYDDLDRSLKFSAWIVPKVLNNVSDEVDAGYSRFFVLRNSKTGNAIRDNTTLDNTMAFYATSDQKVKLWLDVLPVTGGTYQSVNLQINQCVPPRFKDVVSVKGDELSAILQGCPPPHGGAVNTLRILPQGPREESTLQVQCVVLVLQPVKHR